MMIEMNMKRTSRY